MGPEKHCCRLGAAIEQQRLIHATDNFFVIPTLGSIGIEGYLLIVPKNHYLGTGMVPESQYPELIELISDVKKMIWLEYGKPVLIFEHGPRMDERSASCIDHAHLHVVPGVDITAEWAVDMMERLGEAGMFYIVERIEGFERCREMLESGQSYLYVENPDGVRLMSSQNFYRPAQYFRKMVADEVGSHEWDWKLFPDDETLDKTVERLKGMF